MPVMDGVMYEQRQIYGFTKFEGNFSLINRLNQLYYEFIRNPVSAGFNCMVGAIKPSWLQNDNDILLRAFLSVILFIVFLYKYLRMRVSKVASVLTIILFFEFPFFYNYRFGLVSYIPELTSGLFLFSGYLSLLFFRQQKRGLYLFLGIILLFLSTLSRYNFFIYTGGVVLPFLYTVFSFLKDGNLKRRFFFIGLMMALIGYVVFYGYFHYDYFYNYYFPKYPYSEHSYSLAFESITKFYFRDIGVLTLPVIVSIFLLVNTNKNAKKSRWSYVHFLFLNGFFLALILLYVKATNTPHVYAMLSLFLIVLFMVPADIISKKMNANRARVVYIFAFLVILITNLDYYHRIEAFENPDPMYKGQRAVVDHIQGMNYQSQEFNYFAGFDEFIGVNMDVELYRRTKHFVNTKNHFFQRNSGFYSIDENLNFDNLLTYYLNNIEENDYELIVLSGGNNQSFITCELAQRVADGIRSSVMKNRDYQKVKELTNDHYGSLIFYEKVQRE